MAERNFPHISKRTKIIVSLALARANQEEDTDSDIDSDDSYIPESGTIFPPVLEEEADHETLSEDGDVLPEDDDALLDDGQLPLLVANLMPEQSPLPSHSRDVDELHESDEEVVLCQRGRRRQIIESDEESSSNEDSEDAPITYFGKKNCFSWTSIPERPNAKTTDHNIIKIRLSKIIGPALALGSRPTPEEVWRLFITPSIVSKIVMYTNIKLELMRSKIENKNDISYKDTNEIEIDALLGILVFCSIFKSSREDMSSLYNTSITGRPLFRAIMPEKRCSVLLRALRFDDRNTRDERETTDPSACISSIFDDFINNCQINYSPGAHMTVDETLVGFRGRVRFLVYNPRKPAKYGIKIMCLTDAHNSYLYNAYIYTGKGSDGASLVGSDKKLLIPTQAVVRLTKNVFGTHRNITCDNWFSSIELAETLLKNGLTMVGTLKKNKPQIPPEFQPSKGRAVPSSLYGFTKDLTLLSYVPKKNQAVVLLSSMHHSECFDEGINKPEIIGFYNATKGGVDTLDMKCNNYCANRKTRRWPLAVFYHLLAVAGSNGHTLHAMFKDSKKMKRYDFTKEVALGLVHNFLKIRSNIPNLNKDLKQFILKTVEESSRLKNLTEQRRPSNDGSSTSRSHQGTSSIGPRKDKLERRVTCRFCPYQKKRKAGYKCLKCDEPTCAECSRKICLDCASN